MFAQKVKYVAHLSLIDKFIAGAFWSQGDLTLKDLFGSDQYKQTASAFGTVGRDAKLNAAKILIDGNPDCSDVLVTEDGTKNGKALGWITNVILAEKCRAF